MFKITLHILIVGFFMGCTTFQWKQPVQRTSEMPLVFNQYQSLGTGLKYSGLGYHAMPCLESFKTTLVGGTLDIEFRKVNDNYQGENLEIDNFIESGLKRVKKYNLGNHEPVSFILIMKVNNRLATIQEETIKFRADVEKLISSGNQEMFFRTCGTEYIHTIQFDSEIFFFFSYYPKSAESAALLENELKKRITKDKNNIFQVSIFKDLKLNADTFFSLKVDTDILFEPIEFAFRKMHGNELDLFLNKLIHSVLNSDNGKIKNYISSPWTRLDALRNRTSHRSDVRISEYSDEQIFKSLQLLEDSIKQYRLRFREVNRMVKEAEQEAQNTDPDSCAIVLKNASKYISWGAFNECRQAVTSSKSIDLESLTECSPITVAISDLNSSSNCFKQVETGETQQT
ncbi:hypothetical protein KKA14_20515, partial [bacterium]|nr:hypothetical protein [bacterium]